MASPSFNSRTIANCQICNSDKLTSVLFLGNIPPVNTMRDIGTVPSEELSFPLELVRCENCSHVQIGLEVSPEILFPYSYPYLSGSTKILRDNFAELCEHSQELLGIKPGDFVVDVGSNDGSLLTPFLHAGFRVLGIDPSRAVEVARSNGIDSINDYFNYQNACGIVRDHGKAKLVTAANVFAHMPDLGDILKGIVELLDADGVFVSESHYLPSLVETLQYDTVYHEHLRYYHLDALRNLFSMHGLEIFSAKKIPTHGGSIRVFAARKGHYSVDNSVNDLLQAESDAGIINGQALSELRIRVIQSKLDLHALLAPIKASGSKIYGIGAPSRASTLINYVGLDDGILDCVMEISTSHKLNKYIPGTRIPVLDEAQLYVDQPDYALLLSWHIADELINILKKKGFEGKFIIALPTPIVVS